jgi:hypothetical protein
MTLCFPLYPLHLFSMRLPKRQFFKSPAFAVDIAGFWSEILGYDSSSYHHYEEGNQQVSHFGGLSVIHKSGENNLAEDRS